MTPMSELPYEELRVGMMCMSARGLSGVITQLIPEDDGTICILWISGSTSKVYAHLTDEVMVDATPKTRRSGGAGS